MHCPVCNNIDTKVVDTRESRGNLAVRRRRECQKCRYRFSTIEEVELLDLIVIKSDGRREMYMPEKLAKGVQQSLSKRPFTKEDFRRLVHAIERDLQKKREREVSTKAIGEVVMKHLRGFDKVAYIRFASVYRDFKDAKSFAKEIKKLK
ncbi:MAG: transcriptional regulator NrdR [bacterium]|nr:transcriptional regulator NrdR [bacterium]